METWKIGVIAALLLSLVGYGVFQQQQESPATTTSDSGTSGNAVAVNGQQNKAADFIGQSIGGAKIPAWNNIGPWDNTKAPIALGSLKGKAALIEFFRINCSHCQEAAPFMEALYKRYHPRGLAMVAIQSPAQFNDPENAETKWPSVQQWVKEKGLTYPIGFDKDSKYFQGTIKGTFYPTMMVVNPAGKVVYAETGHDTEKAITLAIELEKQFPGAGTTAQRAGDLAKFLRPLVPGMDDAKMFKALTDDLQKRLEGKVAAKP